MAGALYIWIILALFVVVVGVMILMAILFRLGHWWERKTTGATHGFLEVPEGSRSRPAPRSTDLPDTPASIRPGEKPSAG